MWTVCTPDGCCFPLKYAKPSLTLTKLNYSNIKVLIINISVVVHILVTALCAGFTKISH